MRYDLIVAGGEVLNPGADLCGTTDAGSAGSANFAGLRHILETQVKTRVRAFVNLSAIAIAATSRGGE
jgi:predicted amidohydrolase